MIQNTRKNGIRITLHLIVVCLKSVYVALPEKLHIYLITRKQAKRYNELA